MPFGDSNNIHSLTNYQQFELPASNCIERVDTPYTLQQETVCQIHVDNYARRVLSILGETFDSATADQIITHSLKHAHPEFFVEALCKDITTFKQVPECDDSPISIHEGCDGYNNLPRNDLLSALTKAPFLSPAYRQLTVALQKTPPDIDSLSLFDFPLQVQRSILNRLRLHIGLLNRDLKAIFSSSIYERTIYHHSTKKHISPLEYVFGQRTDVLANIFVNIGVSVETLNVKLMPTEKLFWVLPGMKEYNQRTLEMSLQIFDRAVREKNTALLEEVLSLGHLPNNDCLKNNLPKRTLSEAVKSENDSMIGVFVNNGFSFAFGESPLEIAAEKGHFARVAQLLRNNLHGQRNAELIERAIEFANMRQGCFGWDNNFTTDPKVDYTKTLKYLNAALQNIQYTSIDEIIILA